MFRDARNVAALLQQDALAATAAGPGSPAWARRPGR
jgi:hypothetical protein